MILSASSEFCCDWSKERAVIGPLNCCISWRQSAGKELANALRDTCGALVRAMKLKMLALENPLANTVGIQGYVEPDEAIMQEVQTWLKQAVKDCHIRLADEPVLFKAGLSAETLPHMDYGVAVTAGQCK